MRIDKAKLVEVRNSLVGLLDRQDIRTTQDLKRFEGQAFPIEGKPYDYVIVERSSSNFGTSVLSMAYVITKTDEGRVGGGVPINVYMNQELGYSKIILKCTSFLEGYMPFIQDAFGNLAQEGTLSGTNLRHVVEVLKRLE